MPWRCPINLSEADSISIELEEDRAVRIATYEPRNFKGVEALWEEVFPDDPPWNAASIADGGTASVHVGGRYLCPSQLELTQPAKAQP